MISNERPSPFHRQPYRQPYQQQPRPFVQEDTLKSSEIQIERKFFVVTLKENPRGRFLRITEEVGGKRNTIIIPATGLDNFNRVLTEMVQADSTLLSKPGGPQEPLQPVACPPSPQPPVTEETKPAKKTMSESARAKISAAAKARWAKIKALGKTPLKS